MSRILTKGLLRISSIQRILQKARGVSIMKIVILMLVLVCSTIALAESATQTDWKSGPGIYGPVTTWGDRFYVATSMDWDTEPGQVKLVVDRSENTIASGVNAPYYVVANDMNLNGHTDVAYCSYGSGAVYWAQNMNGLGTQWTHNLVGNLSQAQFIAVGDFDNDGLRDIAASSADLNTVVWFRNETSGVPWAAPITVASNFDARQIRTQDMDGDGNLDIVGVSYESGDVVWWRNTNNGNNWSINYIDGALMGAYAVAVGDLNNNGHPDVAAVSLSTGRVVAYLSQNPYGYSWNQQEVGTFTGARAVALADINDDGKLDIVVGSGSGNGSLRWYNHVSGSTWNMNTINGTAPGLRSIEVADMDGDGSPDIIVACRDANRIYWFKNFLKMGEPWERYDVSTWYSGARGVSVGDLNGNGVLDVIGCAETGNKVSWWRVSGFTSPGWLTSSILDIVPIDPDGVGWEYIHWSQTLPPNTGVRFRLKTSYDLNMGSWSPWITSAGSLAGVVSQGGRYIQYQVELYTNNPNVTPSLKDVTIIYDLYVDVEGGTEQPADGRRIWLPQGNPVVGAFTVYWHTPEAGNVTVTLFDATGRAVTDLHRGDQTPGNYSAMVGSLPTGIYTVVVTSPDGMAAQRVTVMN
jgi:hypothetical protein